MLRFFRRRRARSAQTRQPADAAVEFDEHAYGCPLTALKKTCFEARANYQCPHFRALQEPAPAGQRGAIRWKCAMFLLPDLASEALGRLVGVQAAVEKRGDLQGRLLSNLVAQNERLAVAHEHSATDMQRVFGGSGRFAQLTIDVVGDKTRDRDAADVHDTSASSGPARPAEDGEGAAQ